MLSTGLNGEIWQSILITWLNELCYHQAWFQVMQCIPHLHYLSKLSSSSSSIRVAAPSASPQPSAYE